MTVSMRWSVMAACWLCVCSQTGCLTLSGFLGEKKSPTLDTRMLETQGYSIPPGGMPSPVAPDPSGKPRVILEVREGETHLESIPLPMDRAVFIEELVQEARLHDRFGQLSISIMRPTEAGNPPLRMDTATDTKGKAKNVGQNYALQPGDHIIVNSDNRTSLERWVEKNLSGR